MEPVIVATLIGIAAYFIVVGLIPRKFLVEPTKYTRTMLEQLERETSGRTAQGQDTLSIMREHLQKANFLTRVFFTLPGAAMAYPRLIRAGMSDSIDKFFIACLILGLVLLYLLKGNGIFGIIAAVVITYYVAWSYIKRRIRKRNGAFLNAFPDALDMIVRSVRSGYPLNAAVRMVAENMQPPVSTEFKQVADETAYGSTLMEALHRLSMRVDESDIRFFVVVLTVQQEVGGNLAEVLGNLSEIIRKRKHLRLKIRALTSEGRATAWVLGLLPLFVFLMIHFVTPSHLAPFFTTGMGNVLLGLAVGMVVGGIVIVRKMANIQV